MLVEGEVLFFDLVADAREFLEFLCGPLECLGECAELVADGVIVVDFLREFVRVFFREVFQVLDEYRVELSFEVFEVAYCAFEVRGCVPDALELS